MESKNSFAGLTNIAESCCVTCGKALPQKERREINRARVKFFMQLSAINGLKTVLLALRNALLRIRATLHCLYGICLFEDLIRHSTPMRIIFSRLSIKFQGQRSHDFALSGPGPVDFLLRNWMDIFFLLHISIITSNPNSSTLFKPVRRIQFQLYDRE